MVLLCTLVSYAQVGINTTSPATGALLDVYSTDKGMLIPRVLLLGGIFDNTAITPSATTGLLIYNHHTSGGPNGVSPGFYYRLGTQWIRIQDNDRMWSVTGNNNINNGTHFLGTTNNRQVDFRTNNTNRLRISGNANQILAMANGSNLNPFYSWNDNPETGIWHNTNDQLNIGAGRMEFITLVEAGTDELVINETGEAINTRIKTIGEDNMLFIDGANNRIGIKTANPQTTLHLADDATLRIDELNYNNNTDYISNLDPMPVYVNTSGDLQLRPSLVQNFFEVHAINFLNSGIIFNRTSLGSIGGELTQSLYNTSISLTQSAIVHVNYQVSVQISRTNGATNHVVVDGVPRKYEAWVEVNGTSTKIAFDADMYTNMPDPNSTGGTYAAGYYYLSGSASIQLPAGNHTFRLRGKTESRSGFPYYIIYGQSAHERFQIVVQR